LKMNLEPALSIGSFVATLRTISFSTD